MFQKGSGALNLETYLRQHSVSEDAIGKLKEQKVTLENMKDLDMEALKEFGLVWGDRTAVMKAINAY